MFMSLTWIRRWDFIRPYLGCRPAVVKPDHAKWMLEDPKVNFAITSGAVTPAIDHLGFQVESDEKLASIAARLDAAGQQVVKQENATCCYAQGNKGWVHDPSGISWETFHTFGESTVYGNDIAPRTSGSNGTQLSEARCAPAASAIGCCGAPKAA
jgi:hypothetical protein